MGCPRAIRTDFTLIGATYSAVLQATTQLCAADVESLDALWHLVGGLIFVCCRQVGHHLERNHLDVEFALIFGDQFLSISD